MKRGKFLSVLIFSTVLIFNSVQAQIKTESIEDWETGNMSQYDWQTGGQADWYITDQDPYEGVYCAQSGLIYDNQTSWLSLEFDVYSAENISFWLKVSSEQGWDFLRFYIDGNMINDWSGEVSWQQVSYPVSAGTHTFKWEYYKDGSISSGADAAWIDYIVFPPMEIEAFFTTDTVYYCENDIVTFYDQSVGPITEWYWTFEGGMPNTSTEQNPEVTYENEGEWDVILHVSDGVETSTMSIPDYMTIGSVPEIAPTPTGISLLCASWGSSSYSTTGMSGITSYDWLLEPANAGTVAGTSTNATVIWDENFLGDATLKVAGINYCGVGEYSEPLNISVYLPEVSLMLIAFVSISTPPFQLTGESPPGGEFSGPGVSNGMFDPAAAGLGEHIITYTYTDPNYCTNSATDMITVTEFTGVYDQPDYDELVIYPNPNNGNFTIKAGIEINESVDLRIYSTLNKIVFEEKNVSVNQDFSKNINLSNLAKGIYYVHITGNKTDIVKKIIIR